MLAKLLVRKVIDCQRNSWYSNWRGKDMMKWIGDGETMIVGILDGQMGTILKT